MSGIVGSRLNIRGSGLIGGLGTDGQVLTSAGAGQEIVFESVSSAAVSALNNATANELVTVGSTTTELDAESGLTYTDGALVIGGTTPSLTIGDAGAEDTKIVFDGNAQDFHIGLDDTADDLVIGKGSALGTTPAIEIDSDLKVNISVTTASTSASTGSLTTGGGAGIGADLYVGDDAYLITDSAVLGFGADKDTLLTHTDGTGLTLNSTNKLCFNDASQFVQGSSATVLSIGATDEIDLTATAVDLNGTLNVSGVATFQATPVFPDGSLALADLDIDGGTDIGADIVDADLFIIDDGAGGTNRKTAASRLKTYAGGASTMDGLTDVKVDGTNWTNSYVMQTGSDGAAPTLATFGSDCYDNLGIGVGTFQHVTDGHSNVGLGNYCLDALTTGDSNTCVGATAGSAISTGIANTTIGWKAGNSIDTGVLNLSVGQESMSYGNNRVTTGDYNIAFGSYAMTSDVDAQHQLVMGYGLVSKGDNTFFVAGSAGAYNQENNAAWTTTSDSRIKKNIVDSSKGVDAINQVQVRNFNYRPDSEIEIDSFKKTPIVFDEEFRAKRPEYPKTQTNTYNTEKLITGVIAQEFQTCFPESVKVGIDGVLAVSKDELIWALVKSVQELSADVETLKAG